MLITELAANLKGKVTFKKFNNVFYRWIKLEEDIEEGSGRWSKPYIPKLSYKALSDLKYTLADSYCLLDIEDSTLQGIANRICECLVQNKIISKHFQHILNAMLLARHHHYNQKDSGRSIHKEPLPKLKKVSNSIDSATGEG